MSKERKPKRFMVEQVTEYGNGKTYRLHFDFQYTTERREHDFHQKLGGIAGVEYLIRSHRYHVEFEIGRLFDDATVLADVRAFLLKHLKAEEV